LPFVPGTVTASEVLAATELGHTHLKFFPAEQSGGAKTIAALAAPLAGLGVRFMPTGGIRLADLDKYLELSNVFAVGGTWIAPRDAITHGRFDSIFEAAVTAVTAVAKYNAAPADETRS
jgi:2-dehydro-3-deoxyphosphogluconate aldolase/(4S)-4-hydroxy-2-oxoglutarate aldolase